MVIDSEHKVSVPVKPAYFPGLTSGGPEAKQGIKPGNTIETKNKPTALPVQKKIESGWTENHLPKICLFTAINPKTTEYENFNDKPGKENLCSRFSVHVGIFCLYK